MRRSSLKRLSLAFGSLAIVCAASSPARADYSIVRWTWGDCKIWYDASPPALPGGSGWAILADTIPSYEQARLLLEDFYRQGICR